MVTKLLVRLSIGGLLIALALTVWNLSTKPAPANAALNPGSPEALGVIVLSLDTSPDGHIQYVVGVEMASLSAGGGVEYDNTSIEGINRYKAFNQAELQRLVATYEPDARLPIMATFAQALDQQTFTELVTQYEIEVQSYIIWIDNDDGTTTTIQGSPLGGELVPTERFNYVIDDVNQRGAETFLGWVELTGFVKVAHLTALADDSRLFLLDVMEAVVQEKFTEEALIAADISLLERQIIMENGLRRMIRPSLANAMRDLGLIEGVPPRPTPP